MKPRDATSHKDMIRLQSDNKALSGFWILLNSSSVTITAQRGGHSPTAQMTIPRRQFNTMVDWYMRDQKPRKRPSRP